MTDPMQDFNTKLIDEFRENSGNVGGMFEGWPLLLLHHVGAKSGAERIAPLAYMRDGDRYVIFASKAGAPNHPGWFHNLKANPETSIEVGGETISVVASEADGADRERLYEAISTERPQFAEYQQKTTRVIPVVFLTPA